ncbi:MAG: ANTAR domain-containing protein [Actinomycetota bacterium]|nr:ANTAR domain-containing protein [Actinomycetota bacterium]
MAAGMCSAAAETLSVAGAGITVMADGRAGITMDEAFTRLRAHARSHNLKLSSLAASPVESTPPRDQLSKIVESPGSETPRRMPHPAIANSEQA